MIKTREQLQKNTDWEEKIKDLFRECEAKDQFTHPDFFAYQALDIIHNLLHAKQMEYQQRETDCTK